jgi:dCMP deaminase
MIAVLAKPTRSAERNRELLRWAYRSALSSPDPSTQTGALLASLEGDVFIVTPSCNDFPRGVSSTDDRLERPLKYSVVEHAERNAIYAAARHGVATDGALLVTVWMPCADCARAIIQAGIAEILVHAAPSSDRWDSSIGIGVTMLDEAGVTITFVEEALGACAAVLRAGELFNP